MMPEDAAATIRGEVVQGDQRGRLLGFPTANVWLTTDLAAVIDGVYAGWLTRLDAEESWPAAISVGTNPTFAGQRARRIESHVLDRDDLALYGVEVEITLIARLRGMVAFDSVDALVEQMRRDVVAARAALGARRTAAADRGCMTIGA
jgi:riboflavin kinase/FMN adenylyltransferase